MPERTPKPEPKIGSIEDFPPPFRREPPQPARRRMPARWKPNQRFDYLIILENFYVGTRLFTRADHVRHGDPLANKLLYECPQWVHPVDLKELNKELYDA